MSGRARRRRRAGGRPRSDNTTSRRGEGAGQGRGSAPGASVEPVRGTVRAHLFGEETGGTDSKVRAGGESTDRVMLNSPRQGATTLSLSRRCSSKRAHSTRLSLLFSMSTTQLQEGRRRVASTPSFGTRHGSRARRIRGRYTPGCHRARPTTTTFPAEDKLLLSSQYSQRGGASAWGSDTFHPFFSIYSPSELQRVSLPSTSVPR